VDDDVDDTLGELLLEADDESVLESASFFLPFFLCFLCSSCGWFLCSSINRREVAGAADESELESAAFFKALVLANSFAAFFNASVFVLLSINSEKSRESHVRVSLRDDFDQRVTQFRLNHFIEKTQIH